MTSTMSNVGKGRVMEMARLIKNNTLPNAAFVFRMLKAAEAHSVLQDYDTLADVLAAAGNTECDFTNYPAGGIILDDTDIELPTVDDSGNLQEWDNPQFQIADAGGATNNTIAVLAFCFDYDTTSGDDSDIVPISFHDDGRVTDGSTEIWLAGTLARATDPA